jgi:hypothetical protein
MAVCSHGTYKHIPGDFPEYGPPQTEYVGTTADGTGSVFRVGAPVYPVVAFYINGAGQENYTFQLQGTSLSPATLLWREQSDFNCRGTLDVKTDPANPSFTLYAAEPSATAFAMSSATPGMSPSSSAISTSVSCQTDVGTLHAAVDAYIADHNGLGSLQTGEMIGRDLETLVSAGYLRTDQVSCSSITLTGPDASGQITITGR